MNSMLSLLPADGWPRFMLDAIWQSTLIGACGLIAARFLTNRAAARAWLLLLTLSACLLVPLASMAARSSGWSILSRDSEAVGASAFFVAETDGVEHSQPAVLGTTAGGIREIGPRTAEPLAPMRFNWLYGLGILWATASALLFLRLLLSLVAVTRLIRHANPCEVASRVEAAAQAAIHLGLRHRPRVLVSSEVSAPMVLALVPPVILIPTRQPPTAGDVDWVATFTHELAHVLRGDNWSRLWAQLVAIALPLQPLVWSACRSFRIACEEACDDWVVASGCDAVDLAATLTAWTGGHVGSGSAVAIGMSSTKARILRLLALRTKPRAVVGRGWRWVGGFAAVVLVAGLALAQTPPSRKPSTKLQPVAQIGTPTTPAAAKTLPDKPVDKAPETITIAGSCVDENKKPVANARVRLFFVNYFFGDLTRRQVGDVRTNDAGEFRLTDVNLDQVRERRIDLKVVAQAPGKATAFSRWIIDKPPGEQSVNLILAPSATMRGRIVNEDGKPVIGAIVSKACGLHQPPPGICAAVTDADGYYEIADLRPFDLADQKPQPSGDGGFIRTSGCYGQVRHAEYAQQPFLFTKIPSTIDVTMKRVAIVKGQIVTAEDGQAAVGARVEFYSDTVPGDYWTRTKTDADGRYELATLPPGEYRFFATLNGRPNVFRLKVPLHSGENTLDVRMEKGATIQGQLIDVGTGKVAVLQKGEIMQITTHDGGSARAGMNSALVEADGKFTLLVPAGNTYLGMYIGPNWRGVNTDELFRKATVVAEGQVLNLEIRVKARE